MGSRVERQGPGWQTRHDSGWQSVWPHICLWINQEAQLGSETDHSGSPCREIKPQTSDCKHLWRLRQQREKLPASQKSSLERPTGA